MYWKKNVVLFIVLVGITIFAIPAVDGLLPANCTMASMGLPFLTRLAVYSTLPISLHLFIYALLFPNLTAKRIVVAVGTFHLAVIFPSFLVIWGLGWLFALLAGWGPFPEQSWLSLWHSILTLLPAAIIVITTTLWLLKKPYFDDIAAHWKTMGKVLFLFLIAISICALGVVQVILTFGCL